MNENEVLQNVAGTINEEPVSFDVGYTDWLKRKRKRSFPIKPLVLGSLTRISKLFLGIDLSNITSGNFATAVLELMKDHSHTTAEIVAIAVTNQKKYPSKKLIEFFIYHLDAQQLNSLLAVVLKQADMMIFINTIVSIRSLNVLEKKENGTAKSEASPQSQGS
jgi:hypothetical protein